MIYFTAAHIKNLQPVSNSFLIGAGKSTAYVRNVER